MKLLARRIAVFAVGLLCVFAALEAGLRLSGALCRRFAPLPPAQMRARCADADFLVLCLGDSRTFGMGAPEGGSYPARLEEKLNALGLGRVVVINHGMLADNTWHMHEKLRAWLAAPRRPDLVILLGGQANFWNFKGLPEDFSNTGLFARLRRNLRILRLADLLFTNLGAHSKETAPAAGREQDLAASPLFGRELEKDLAQIEKTLPPGLDLALPDPAGISPQDQSYWQARFSEQDSASLFNAIALAAARQEPDKDMLASLYVRAGKQQKSFGNYDLACLCFIRALRLRPMAGGYFNFSMALLSKNIVSLSLRMCLREFCVNPNEEFPYMLVLLWHRRSCLPELRRQIEELNLRLPPNLRKVLYSADQKQKLTEWMAAQLEDCVRLCKDREIPVFLLGDINHQFAEPWIYDNISRKYNVPYIRVQSLLLKSLNVPAEKMHATLQDFLAGDRDHPNGRGYSFMADCAVDEILKTGLLKTGKGKA